MRDMQTSNARINANSCHAASISQARKTRDDVALSKMTGPRNPETVVRQANRERADDFGEAQSSVVWKTQSDSGAKLIWALWVHFPHFATKPQS